MAHAAQTTVPWLLDHLRTGVRAGTVCLFSVKLPDYRVEIGALSGSNSTADQVERTCKYNRLVKQVALNRASLRFRSADEARDRWLQSAFGYQSCIAAPVLSSRVGVFFCLFAFHPDRDAFSEVDHCELRACAERVGRELAAEEAYRILQEKEVYEFVRRYSLKYVHDAQAELFHFRFDLSTLIDGRGRDRPYGRPPARIRT
jgi:hypothetical protein